MRKILLIVWLAFMSGSYAWAQEQSDDEVDLFNLSLEELMDINLYDDQFNLYGFINANTEKVFNVPSVDSEGRTVTETEPVAWSPVQNFHIYGSGNLSPNISVFFNLAYSNERLEVREASGNFKITDAWQIRVGKMYRRFGLYNERLDQIPTIIGIEPPELFDQDHLFLTRTTNLMLHGNQKLGQGELSYALTTGSAEGGNAKKDVIPLGWDFRYRAEKIGVLVGTSGYASGINGQPTTSTVDFGTGSPRGGVLPWMEEDRFTVIGGFLEKRLNRWLIQTAYWRANHQAVRNPEHVLTMIREAGINQNQRTRFLGENSPISDAELTPDNVIRAGQLHDVHLLYPR